MAEFAELWLLGMLLAAFAGGAFGAALGALPAFIFTGFLVMLGEGVKILAGDLSGVAGFDPSTMEQAGAIVMGILLIAILATIGLFPSAAWIPLPF